MDNLTHTMAGVAVSEAFFRPKYGRRVTWLFVIASNLPDLDVLLGFFGIQDALLLRRTLTHSVLVAPIIALGATLLCRRWFKDVPLALVWAWWLGGLLLHVFLDLINSYGVVLLYPLSMKRFELAWVFIIDFTIWGILLAPLLLNWAIPYLRHSEFKKTQIWKATTLVFFLYIGLCGVNRAWAHTILTSEMKNRGMSPNYTYIFPEPMGFHRFRGVVREQLEYKIFQVNLAGDITLYRTVFTIEDERIQQLLSEPRMKRLASFLKAPVWRIVSVPDGFTEWLEVYDLRYASTVVNVRFKKFEFRFGPYEIN